MKDQSSNEREPTFAQPVIKTTHYERDEFGIVSPSDLRRPKENSYIRVVGKHQARATSGSKGAVSNHLKSRTSKLEESTLELENQDAAGKHPSKVIIEPENDKITAKEASDRESSFINAFFADELKSYDRGLSDSKSWRQTALQRGVVSDSVPQLKVEPSPVAKAETPATELVSTPVRETIVIPSSQALVDNYPYPKIRDSAVATVTAEKKPQQTHKHVGWSVPEPAMGGLKVDASPASSTFTRSPSDKLEKLPKDDIDLLSAADIRAAMGRKKRDSRSSEEKKQDRQKLETGYEMAQPETLDEVVEAHLTNNFYVRRTQQALERASKASEVVGSKAGQIAPQLLPGSTKMESSIDRMRRWIEEGSASISKHFWQNPIEADAPSEADIQFAKQMIGLNKGRRAREHISDDLELDLPMCKGLLERLKIDENRVEQAVYLLRSPKKITPRGEMSKNLRAIRERRLRKTYERTEKQFELAYQEIRALQNTEAIAKATNAFKRRLGIASKVLHKNHTLTRMLTWSAQARLDEPGLERSKVELYSEILTRLATLRDTQLALSRLMDHAVQLYRVTPSIADEALSRSIPASTDTTIETFAELDALPSVSEKATVKPLADAVATAHLADEVQSQKVAMQGLSDDGYVRAPKQTPRRSFEEKSPLAHSLFRPFNLQLESLSKRTKEDEAAAGLKEVFKQKIEDKKLVQEVRSAYEDVYGPITMEHRQVPQTEEYASTAAQDTKVPNALKEHENQQDKLIREDVKPCADITTEPSENNSTVKEVDATPRAILPSTVSDAVGLEPSRTAAAAAKPADEMSETTLPIKNTSSASSKVNTETIMQDASISKMATHYTILIHNPQTDTLSITTSTSELPRDTSPALPIHQALASLKAPEKFIPYITSGLEVVTSKRHMLVLRDALDKSSSTRGFETIGGSLCADPTPEPLNSEVNPIDGTTRLSPTGYSGVEESQEQLERDFEERRQAAAATEAARSEMNEQSRDDEVPKKKRGGIGGVVKTAIWASAVCYIAGVTAEILR